jgi:tripartite-type tricarboxylate transporter receptor subunit TctC
MKRLLAFLVAAIALPASAQSWPAKPVRVIVNVAPGGVADITARVLGAKLTETLGQPFIIENRAGGDGYIGFEAVARAEPDGYTMVYSPGSSMMIAPHIVKRADLDPMKALTPVVPTGRVSLYVMTHPKVPVANFKEFLAYARANPGKLTFASAGPGTASHLAGELFKTMAKVDMLHIPYKGNVPAITDLLAGQTSLLFATMPTVLPHAKAGKLRALATIGASRAAATPELPTIGESLRGFEVSNWIALFAPAGTAPDIVKRWNAEVQRIMQSPEIQARLPNEGARFIPMTPEQFGAFQKSEIAKWAPVVKASGARAD